MVTTIADGHPGDDEWYSHQVDLDMIEDWIAAGQEAGVGAVMDIQPGFADIQVEFDRIKHLLGRFQVSTWARFMLTRSMTSRPR
jgi:hypothetical protein